VATLEQIARELERNNARRQRILARSPQMFSGMDAEQVAAMSDAELARRELKELNIEPGSNDPVALLDAHHAGRQWAREQMLGRSLGKGGASTSSLIGEARDSATETFLDKYLKE
jgi:hypothetical protein